VEVGGQSLRLLNTVLHDLAHTLVVHTAHHIPHLYSTIIVVAPNDSMRAEIFSL
jgi:hypothetical protein